MEGGVYPEEVSTSSLDHRKRRTLGAQLLTFLTLHQYIPNMIRWYKAGCFPIEQLVKFYPVRDFSKAVKDMEDGVTIKPVLIW